jgi:hypothetical protein
VKIGPVAGFSRGTGGESEASSHAVIKVHGVFREVDAFGVVPFGTEESKFLGGVVEGDDKIHWVIEYVGYICWIYMLDMYVGYVGYVE